MFFKAKSSLDLSRLTLHEIIESVGMLQLLKFLFISNYPLYIIKFQMANVWRSKSDKWLKLKEKNDNVIQIEKKI